MKIEIFTFHLAGHTQHTEVFRVSKVVYQKYPNGKQCRINWSKWQRVLKLRNNLAKLRNHVIEQRNSDRWAVWWRRPSVDV